MAYHSLIRAIAKLMGRDNQPKDRQRIQLERKENQRDSYERILIVSEGTKTEPLYFKEIRSTVNRAIQSRLAQID